LVGEEVDWMVFRFKDMIGVRGSDRVESRGSDVRLTCEVSACLRRDVILSNCSWIVGQRIHLWI